MTTIFSLLHIFHIGINNTTIFTNKSEWTYKIYMEQFYSTLPTCIYTKIYENQWYTSYGKWQSHIQKSSLYNMLPIDENAVWIISQLDIACHNLLKFQESVYLDIYIFLLYCDVVYVIKYKYFKYMYKNILWVSAVVFSGIVLNPHWLVSCLVNTAGYLRWNIVNNKSEMTSWERLKVISWLSTAVYYGF